MDEMQKPISSDGLEEPYFGIEKCLDCSLVKRLGAERDEARSQRDTLDNILSSIVALLGSHIIPTAEQEVTKDSPTLNDLAKAQGVKPLTDVGTIVGTWPGEKDDGFEQVVDDLRKGTK